MESSTGNVPEVTDKTPRFAGISPEKRKWIMIGGALLVIAIIGLSNAGSQQQVKATAHTQTTPMQVRATTPEQAEAFKRQFRETTDSLAQANERMAAMKANADRMAAGTQTPAGSTPQQTPPQQPVQYAAPVSAREQKEDTSVAYSFRPHGGMRSDLPTPQNDIQRLLDAQKAALAATLQATPQIQPQAQSSTEPPKTMDAKAKPDGSDLNRATGKTYRIFEDTIIESTLVNRLNGTFTGPVIVLVTKPVYSHDREHVLIPVGSRVLGEAQQVGSTGQKRLAVVFHRLLMPDGYAVPLDTFLGLNQIGETGLKDLVDNHYLQVFGTSIALGLVQGFSMFGTGSQLNGNGTDQYRQGVANSIGQSSSRVLENRLNILPQVVIREGHRVGVILRQDLDLPAYENHRMPGDL